MGNLLLALAFVFDLSNPFISNTFPKRGEEIEISFWISKNQLIDKAELHQMFPGNYQEKTLTKFNVSNKLDGYKTKIKVNSNLEFYFVLKTKDASIFFADMDGIHERYPKPDRLFKIVADFDIPNWINKTVFYQIFPDRFFKGRKNTPQIDVSIDGVKRLEHKDWNEEPLDWDKSRCNDYFGGDLEGIRQKIPYLKELGINAIYLNPIFKSPPNHKYHTEDYFQVDPSFGTNQELASLIKELHDNNIKIVLDGVFNHTGLTHPWFKEAVKNKNSKYVDYYIFLDYPKNYVSWVDMPDLPTLNYKNNEVRDSIYKGKASVIQYWLKEPYQIDGWRFDVAEFIGNNRVMQIGDEVLREFRKAIKQYKNKFMLGEIFDRSFLFLQGDMMDSGMNYYGFTTPVWNFVGKHDRTFQTFTGPIERKKIVSDKAVLLSEELDNVRNSLPAGVQNIQFNLLSSHDTPRLLYITGEDKKSAMLAAAILFTYPGVPSIYYGDEAGLSGNREPYNRRTFKWNKIDKDLFELYKKLVSIRKNNQEFAIGAYIMLYAQDGILAYARLLNSDNFIISVFNSNDASKTVKIPIWKLGADNTKTLSKLINEQDKNVTVNNDTVTINLKPKGFEILKK